ncbi:MAG TPA: hypothetical protein PKC39_08290 [Ferruginibacter sp.]|nr:hypothetical protein [Ferruginibacter sp.]HMP20941.1 hypothetical protein [Ferruginibacter sp.]
MSKQVRVSSVIILRWLDNSAVEVFKNLSQLYKKYTQNQLGVSRRVLHNQDLSAEYITDKAGIKKSPIN